MGWMDMFLWDQIIKFFFCETSNLQSTFRCLTYSHNWEVWTSLRLPQGWLDVVQAGSWNCILSEYSKSFLVEFIATPSFKIKEYPVGDFLVFAVLCWILFSSNLNPLLIRFTWVDSFVFIGPRPPSSRCSISAWTISNPRLCGVMIMRELLWPYIFPSSHKVIADTKTHSPVYHCLACTSLLYSMEVKCLLLYCSHRQDHFPMSECIVMTFLAGLLIL